MVWEFSEVDKELQRRDRWERISMSEYKGWYKEVKGEGIPGYLRKGREESR